MRIGFQNKKQRLLFTACCLQMAVSLLFVCQLSNAQLLTPLSNEMNRRVEYEMIRNGQPLITVLKPYYDTQLKGSARQDSFSPYHLITSSPQGSSWLKRKLLYESLVQVDSGNFYLYADPLFEFSGGKDNSGKNTYVNTRGFRAGGRLGNRFAFDSEIYETQAVVNYAFDKQIRSVLVMPGQGRYRSVNPWDYGNSSGYISFIPFKRLNIRGGFGKNFIGDGYRSLILSDVSYNYPYANINWSNGKWLYSYTAGLTMNLNTKRWLGDNFPLYREVMVNRVLAYNLLQTVQIAVVQNEMYQIMDSAASKRFHNVKTYNPLMVPGLKTGAHQMWGTNLKISLTKKLWLYNQILFDNLFVEKDIRKGWQVGMKWYDALGIRGLFLQTEYNTVDPYTYTHAGKWQQWENTNEPLAHILGNNFKEGIGILEYSYKRWQLSSETMVAQQSKNIDPLWYKTTRMSSFGSNRKLFMQQVRLSFFLNPKTLSAFSLGATYREDETLGNVQTLKYVYFSFSTNLRNLYYDF